MLDNASPGDATAAAGAAAIVATDCVGAWTVEAAGVGDFVVEADFGVFAAELADVGAFAVDDFDVDWGALDVEAVAVEAAAVTAVFDVDAMADDWECESLDDLSVPEFADDDFGDAECDVEPFEFEGSFVWVAVCPDPPPGLAAASPAVATDMPATMVAALQPITVARSNRPVVDESVAVMYLVPLWKM